MLNFSIWLVVLLRLHNYVKYNKNVNDNIREKYLKVKTNALVNRDSHAKWKYYSERSCWKINVHLFTIICRVFLKNCVNSRVEQQDEEHWAKNWFFFFRLSNASRVWIDNPTEKKYIKNRRVPSNISMLKIISSIYQKLVFKIFSFVVQLENCYCLYS